MSTRLRYDKVDKYLIHAKLESPMHIGSGENSRQDILLHPVTRLPFIQASSITGAFRDYYEDQYRNAGILFGSEKEENEHALIKISDGIFTEYSPYLMEFRPRVKINPDSGSVSSSKIKGTNAESGHKFDMEYIGTGAEFVFSVYIYRDPEFDAEIDEHVKTLFSALNNGEIVFGGQKSNGCGDVSVEHLFYRQFDLKNENDRSAWMKEDELEEKAYTDIAGTLSNKTRGIYRIRVTGKIDGGILVKGYQIEGFGKDAPDAVNIKNSKGEYIIPGSALKGTIRSRIEYIAGTIGLSKTVINEIFGSLASDTDGVTGNARFYDTVIRIKEKNDQNSISHRIHIDKFTGGVMYKALFSEKTAYGVIDSIKIDVSDKNDPEKAVGLLILALRDLANGLYNLGGGYHIGQGFINVNTIEIEHNGQKAIIRYKDDEIDDPDSLIERCVKKVTDDCQEG